MQELDGLATLAEKQEKKKSGKQAEETSELPIPATITAAELVGKEFPEPRCIVPDLLPDVGLAMLGGAPKIGKSWLMLHLCIGAAVGGHALGTRQMTQCESLYLALEDTPRRLQQRLTMMLGRDTAPNGCHLATEWPKLPGGGLCLRGWLDDHPNTKLVVVDTLQRFRATQDTRKVLYESDYNDIAQLKAIADQYQLALVVVHHLRKAASDDPLEQLSGTTGLTGAADTIWILKRGRIQASAELLVTGRDVEEQEIALEFNAQVGTWTDIGDAEYHRTTIERQRVVNVLRQASKPMQPKEITEELGMKSSTVRSTLSRMAKDGEVQRTEGGYVLPTTTAADTAAPAAPAAPATPATPTKETISVAGVAPTDEDCNASKGHSSRGLSESAAGVAPVAPDAVDVASSAARSVAPAEAAFRWSEGTALKAYADNRAEAVELGIESDPVAFAVCQLLKNRPGGFEGTMTELLDALEGHVNEKTRSAKAWPGSARSLSNRLRRSSTALRQVGIEIEYCRDMRRRTVRIAALDNACKVASLPSSSSSSEKTPQPSGKSHDAKHDVSVFGDGVCVIHDKGMTQHDASMTQGNKVASSEKPHNKGVSGGHDANDVDDAGMQVLSFAKDEATTDRAAHNMPLDNACISSSASSTSSEGAPKGVNNGVSASDATSDATDANSGTSSTSSETSSDGKSPSLCGLRGVSDATDATDARKQEVSAAEAEASEVFEL